MTQNKKIGQKNFEKYWDKKGRKDMFTWAYRYLRLHSELLIDNVYQSLYNYLQKTLIAYLKKDIKNNKYDDSELGNLVDFFTDMFNKNGNMYVDKYKWLVEELYNFTKEHPDSIVKIRV